MSKTIVLSDKNHSSVVVKDTSIIINRNINTAGEDLTGIIHIMGSVSIEIGRSINQFIDTLKYTRIPIVIKRVIKKGDYSTYQVIRINTGKVPNINLGLIETYKETMVGFIYDSDVVINRRLRKYVKTSVLNMLAIKKEGNYLVKIENVLRLILKIDGEINIKQNKSGSVLDMYVQSKVYKYPLRYRCVVEKDRYVFKSITLNIKEHQQ